MGGIKYYQLAKGEELPDEFCAVRDVGGEPSEYTFYVPEAENVKLRELVRDALTTISWCTIDCCPSDNKKHELNERAKPLGIEVPE